MVPYIDVMLVLLIIFMVTAPMLVQSVPVNLPEVDATPTEVGRMTAPLSRSMSVVCILLNVTKASRRR